MKNFETKWHDLPHFILGITRAIWEERQIHTLERLYAPDILVRSPDGVVKGNAQVIRDTVATLAEFPDRTLLGEDVIWSAGKDAHDGAEPEEEVYLSSHRILSQATHRGDGRYGPASQRALVYRIVADCAAKNNQIYDEWIVRDQGALVTQIGWTLPDYARHCIERARRTNTPCQPLTPDTDLPGVYQGTGNEDQAGHHYAELLQSLWRADFSAIQPHYDRACHLELPGGQTVHGRAAADQFWLGLKAALPDAELRLHHQIGRSSDSEMPPRAALRWSLYGKHAGFGRYGPPSGGMVYIMGISHAEFGPRGLRREWILIDEAAVWKQIILKTG